jgi:hypothetical protein
VKYSVGFIVAGLMFATPLPSHAQAAKGACAVITAADMAAVLGADAKASATGDEQCNITGAAGEYEVHIKRSEAAREMKDWQEAGMAKPVMPLKGIGDEAYASGNGTAVIARKGGVAILVSPAGVGPRAPMPYKQGVVELARRITANLK